MRSTATSAETSSVVCEGSRFNRPSHRGGKSSSDSRPPTEGNSHLTTKHYLTNGVTKNEPNDNRQLLPLVKPRSHSSRLSNSKQILQPNRATLFSK